MIKSKYFFGVGCVFLILFIYWAILAMPSILGPSWSNDEWLALQEIYKTGNQYIKMGKNVERFGESEPLMKFRSGSSFVISSRPNSYIKSISLSKNYLIINYFGYSAHMCMVFSKEAADLAGESYIGARLQAGDPVWFAVVPGHDNELIINSKILDFCSLNKDFFIKIKMS